MGLLKRYFLIVLIFQSSLQYPSFLDFFKSSAPKILSTEFFTGKIKLTDLFQKALDKITDTEKKEAIISKMNDYLKKCTTRDKELFIEMINQTIPKGILASDGLVKNLDNTLNESITLHEISKKNNWIDVLDKSSAVEISKESDFNILKLKLSDLFKSALSGNEKALQKIKSFVIKNEISQLSSEQKRDILKLLQDTTENYLRYVNDTAQEKNEQLMSVESDMDLMTPKLQAISGAQTANTRAVFKYSKDILHELEPICTSSQRLIYSIDRQNINPLINMVDMHDLKLDTVKSLDDLPKAVEHEADRLQKEGKLQIPLHKESRPIFMSTLHSQVLSYNKGYVEHQADLTYKRFQAASDQEKNQVIKEHYTKRPDFEPDFITEQIHNRLSEKISGRGF
jgi:hypothetical protein